jgi:glycosyltransferase involved in cell wall biosynthesis
VDESALPVDESFRPAVLIPVYNHETAIGPTLDEVLARDCPVLLVDDGSGDACARVLEALRERHPDRVSLLRLEHNGGKGAAVKAGLHALLAAGYSHGLQVDADGQHDIDDLPGFLETARQNPRSLVSGYPEFDADVPRVRYYCRYLTHVLVWIHTLSFEIRDSMCGFRVYPLSAMVALLKQESCGDRMDFDPEIMVRWHWRGGQVLNLPTRVRYPLDGVSHFGLLQDNWLITLMHTRLFLGMLLRLPTILGRRIRG